MQEATNTSRVEVLESANVDHTAAQRDMENTFIQAANMFVFQGMFNATGLALAPTAAPAPGAVRADPMAHGNEAWSAYFWTTGSPPWPDRHTSAHRRPSTHRE